MKQLSRPIVAAAHDWASYYDGRSVAITGAGGFIGGRLAERLATMDARVIRVAHKETADPGVWQRAAGADVIFHLGAQTSAAVAAQNPAQDFEVNVAPMRRLLQACGEIGRRPTLIFAGTVTQAGIPRSIPVNEDVSDDPVTIYDRHKLIAEHDLKLAASDLAIRGASLRLSNVYGPGAHSETSDRQILNRMIRKAIGGGGLIVHGSGEYNRDYIFIDDVVDAFLMAAVHIEQLNGRHFVIGTGRGVTVRSAFELIAARVQAATGIRVPVTLDSTAATSAIEQRHFVADSSRFARATGWRPAWDLESGIDRTIEAALCA
jgi:nucleoside-diphosphate-sugar epimerase